jgi:hypothetical protein
LIQKSSKRREVAKVEDERKEFEKQLAESFEGYDPKIRPNKNCNCSVPCVCVTVADFIGRTHKALESSVGVAFSRKGFSRGWFDSEVREAIKVRRAAYAVFKDDRTEANWSEFRKLRSACSRLVHRKKKEDWDRYLDKLEDSFHNDHKQLWRMIHRLVPSSARATASPILRNDGSLAMSEEQILDAWADYREELGKPRTHPLQDHASTEEVDEEVERLVAQSWANPTEGPIGQPFTKPELEESLEALAYHKASSSDKTKNAMFKCGGETMKTELLRLFNFLRERETSPLDWGRALVINLYKDGDQTDPGNYRGISLISCLGKLYFSLWARRLTEYMESKLSEGQGGFRPRRSTVDQALALDEVLLRRQRDKTPTYLYFVDFSKAFDTVWHNGLWKRLWDLGIQGKAWRIIRNLYSSIELSVLVGDKQTRWVRSLQGVRQGCPLSPVLFNCFIDELSERLRAQGYGVEVGDRILHSLLYADDVVLLADSPEELQGLINVVDLFCRQWHMDINLTKSKAMIIPVHGKGTCECDCNYYLPVCDCTCRGSSSCCSFPKWTCRERPVPIVTEYKYLGIWFTSDLKWDRHIEYMLSKARKRSATLQRLLVNNRIPGRAKLLVWMAYVRPLLDYGCEIWSCNSKATSRIESIQTRAGVLIFKLNEKTNTEAVRALMHAPSLESRRLGFRLRYFIKILSCPETRIVRFLTDLAPGPKRTMGPGRAHWISQVVKLINKEPALQAGYSRITDSLNRNGGVLPTDIDTTYPAQGDYEYRPIDEWRVCVQRWVDHRELSNLRSKVRPGSPLTLLDRALKDCEAVVRLPITGLPNIGGDQIRIRLLGGTAALNTTLSHFRDRTAVCLCCEDQLREDVLHFLLYCEKYNDERMRFLSDMRDSCTCGPTEDESNRMLCGDFFEQLDDNGKAVFMLGGPVDGRAPEAEIDTLCSRFVCKAWSLRSEVLQAKLGQGPVVDLTAPRHQKKGPRTTSTRSSTQGNLITNYMRPTPKDSLPDRSTHDTLNPTTIIGSRTLNNELRIIEEVCLRDDGQTAATAPATAVARPSTGSGLNAKQSMGC